MQEQDFSAPSPGFRRVHRLARAVGRFGPVAALLAAVLALAGCGAMPALSNPAATGPFYTPRNHSGEAVLPAGIRRVLLLPVYGGNVADPESVAALDVIMRTALQRQSRFEVIALSREDCRINFGAPEYSSAGALPNGFLERIGRIYAVEGVMFVDLTVYQAYRPLTLGFRAKLATVQGSHLVWTFDETFTTADPAVANSVQRYYADRGQSATPLELAPKVLQSPGRFAAYASDAMFRTLPPR